MSSLNANFGGNVQWKAFHATGKPGWIVVSASMLEATASVAIPNVVTREQFALFEEWQRVAVGTLYRIAIARPDFRQPIDRVYRLQKMLAARPSAVVRFLGNYVEGRDIEIGYLYSVDHADGSQQMVACRYRGWHCDLLLRWCDGMGDLCSLEIMKAGLVYE